MPGIPAFDAKQAAEAKPIKRKKKNSVTTYKTLCASCDVACSVVTEVQQGRVTKVRSSDNPIFRDNICMKGIVSPKGFAHPNRVIHPLRRVGERGSGKWERVSWDDALEDIGARMTKIIDQYGPEAWAVSTSQWNTSTDHGLGRRLMNRVGSPNWISGVAMCAGNTAAINKFTYGWFPMADFANARCIVLFGHNPKRHSWVPIYNMIRGAQARGAKLIVLDPRRSENAEVADIWLPLKAGSDAALMLGWLKVIIDEQLYDKTFVSQWTIGFEDLVKRVNEYPLQRVSELTGCSIDDIQKSARMYATSGGSVIPWTPITDMQRNSTSGIRLQGILRAICGFLDVPGGEILHGFNRDVVSESEIEMHHTLPEEQKAKQLGSKSHPAFTYRGQAPLLDASEKVWGHRYANQVTGCFMANPTETFRAMAGEGEYPVKAFTVLGNNTLMSYANMGLIYKALLNQDLIVMHEQFNTPTAQLADYILPADSWLERPWLTDSFGWTAMYRPSQKSMEPPGECVSTFEFWKRMAACMGHEDVVPWETLEDFYDFRLLNTGMNFSEFAKKYEVYFPDAQFKKYERTGFATPSGKVELKSSVLEDLGFDPLPYFREDPPQEKDFPLMLFTGVREDEYFQTGHRHIPEMRKRKPEPYIFVSKNTAEKLNIQAEEWVEVENHLAKISMCVAISDGMPDNLVRVPHGWWKPEMEPGAGKLSGAFQFSDAMLARDDDAFLDREQGIPHLKGIPCRINKVQPQTLQEEQLLEDKVQEKKAEEEAS